MKDKRELELVNSFKEYLEILIEDFCDINYNNARGKNWCADKVTVKMYKLFIRQLINLLKDVKSKITVSDILGNSTIDEFTGQESVIIAMRDRFQKITTSSNLQKFRNKPLVLGDDYIVNVSGYLEDHSISMFKYSVISHATRFLKGRILDYRLVRRWVSENEPMQIEHELIIHSPIANLKHINDYEYVTAEASNIDDEPFDADVEMVKDDVESVETDMFDTVYDRRRSDIRNRFIEYLNFLINGFKDIDYDKVQSEQRSIELLAKDFVKDLTKLLSGLTTKATISDMLGHTSVEKFTDDMSVSIPLDKRFEHLIIPDNLICLRNHTINLGNNYTITARGNPEYFSIIIRNSTITSPRFKAEDPDGEILFYRIKKLEDSRGSIYYDHTIYLIHPFANLNFIKHYVSNLHFIKHYEESGNVLVEKDNNVVKVDVESVEEDDGWTEERDDTSLVESDSSDNNKTLNFSLSGPNGSKISINLSINISFD